MSPGRGIALKLVSVTVFMAMAALIKSVSDHVPPGEAVFFRSLFAMPVILVWLTARGELKGGLATKNPLGHVWRGLVGAAAMGCGFAGLGLLPLPEVTALGYAAPLLTVVFGAMFLNEQVGLFRLSTVALGMLGVLIVLSPRLSTLGGVVNEAEALGAIVVLTGATFAALAQVFVRRLVQTEQTSAIVFWFSVTSCTMSLLTIPFGWVLPTGPEAVQLVGAGLLGGIGQIFLTSSYRHADASVIAPFEYASMLLALIVGYTLFDEVPSPVMLAGAAIVVLAGVLIILRERRLGIERSRQRRSMTP
jgi:drug/metabolite transporter (DMT)-like permease